MPWWSRIRDVEAAAAPRVAVVESLEGRRLLHAGLDVGISFAPTGQGAPGGFILDSGRAFSYRADSGHRFGWTMGAGGWHNSWTGQRNTAADDATDSFISLGHRGGLAWEIAVPNGVYRLRMGAGDTRFRDGDFHRIAAEGQVVIEHTATPAQPGVIATVDVTVSDGRLTLTAPDGLANSKLAWLRILSIEGDGHGGGDDGGGDDGGGDDGGGDDGGGDDGGGDDGGGDDGGGDGGGGDGGIVLGDWETLSPMPHAVMEGASAELDGTIYIWGGYDRPNVWRSVTRGQAYDTATGTWRTVADLPQALTHFQALPYDGQIYIFGGYVNLADSNGARDDVWVYDPAADAFEHVADMPFSVAGHAATMVGSRAYVVSGMFRQGWNFLAGSPNVFSIDLADPAAGWRTETDLPVARDHTAAVTIDGMIYLVSGQEDDEQYTGVRPDVYRYDPVELTWTRLADMPDGGRGHIDQGVLVYEGRILVVGGNTNGSPGQNYADEVYAYDPGTDDWSLLGEIPLPRMGGAAEIVGDVLYVLGGSDGIPRPQAWRAGLG